MYQRHFNFTGPPFSLAPNPRYVYLSPKHREALAHLLYGISLGGGFIALTGEVGTGKTTLCRCLLEQLPEDVDIALIFNPRLNRRELIATICDELHIHHPGDRTSIKRLIDLLNHHLLDAHARGRRTIVLVDEAQNFSFDVLEQIRLLTNLETNVTKLLQIILVGQPELRQLLASPNLRQLSQRITARYHLLPLSWTETGAYIRHRLAVSGCNRRIFSRLAVFRIYRLSGGIPRLINLICDRALLGAYTLGKHKVDCAIVNKAAREVLPKSSPARTAIAALAVTALLMLVAGLYWKPEGFLSGPQAWVNAAASRFRQIQPAHQEVHAEPSDPSKPPHPSQSGSAAASSEKNLAGQPREEKAKPTQEIPAEPKPLEEKPAIPPPPTEQIPPQQGPGSEPMADFEKLIADPMLIKSLALSRLYSLWGINVPAGKFDECLIAQQNGLRCLNARGDSSLLVSLDHPAMLEFVMADGATRYATLIGLEGQKGVLNIGGNDVTVNVAQWLPYWRGNFFLLWKPYQDITGIIKSGKKSEAVRWLRSQLNAPSAPGGETFFDDRLKQQVMDYQRRKGLPVDGEVGPMTLMHLVKIASPHSGPSLSKPSN